MICVSCASLWLFLFSNSAARQCSHFNPADLDVETERVLNVEAVFRIFTRIAETHPLQFGQNLRAIVIGNGVGDVVDHRLAFRPRRCAGCRWRIQIAGAEDLPVSKSLTRSAMKRSMR